MRKSPIRKLLTFLMITLSITFLMGLAAAAQDTMLARVKPIGASSAKIIWEKVNGADKYVVYHTRCKTPFRENSKKVLTGEQSSVIFGKLNKKRLNKFKVQAYKGSKLLAESLVIHVAMPANSRCTNPKAVKAGPSAATLAVGGSIKIEGSCTKQKAGKSLIKHDKELRFFSTDPSVATVSADGTVKAVKAGFCSIYTVAINGMWSRTSITVTAAAASEPAKPEEVYVLSYAWKFEGGRPEEDPALPSPSKLKAGAAVTLAEAPTLEGYTFQGWDFTEKTMPAKDVVVTGKWTKIKKNTVTYVVLYNSDNGRGAFNYSRVVGTKTDTYNSGEAVSLKDLLLKYDPYDLAGSSLPDIDYCIAYNGRYASYDWDLESYLYGDLEARIRWRWMPMPSSKWAGDYAEDIPETGFYDEDTGEYTPNEKDWVFENMGTPDDPWYLPTAIKINQNYVLFEMLYQETWE